MSVSLSFHTGTIRALKARVPKRGVSAYAEAAVIRQIERDDEMPAKARTLPGTATKRDTVNLALAIAVATVPTPEDRKRTLAWLQEHAEPVLDFDCLAELERNGN